MIFPLIASRRCFSTLLVFVALQASTIGADGLQADEIPASIPDRPNVILILADDFAMGDLQSQNGGVSRTPNLERLANQSVRFINAYSASCVCAPARAAMLTGRYPHRTGVVTLNMNRFPVMTRIKSDERTIADVLAAQDYVTGLVGKWHCGLGEAYHPKRRGFDEFEGFSGSQDLSYFKYTLDVNDQQVPTDDDYLTDDLSRRAIEFVRRHRNSQFFLHLAHYAPHRPLEAPAETVQRYRDKGLNESLATIYAMIEIMDRGIGELLDELDRLELSEKTVVIFASDNGPDPLTGERFNLGRRGMKYEIYEGGIRVPLFVRWPGVFPAGERSGLAHFVDLLPTVAEICHAETQMCLPLDGESLLPDLLGESPQTNSRIQFWQWNRGRPNYTHNAAMRDGPWKLVRPYVNRKTDPKDSTEKPVLYHLENDPSESEDFSGRESRRYEAMKSRLDQWTQDVEKSRNRE